MRIDLFHRCNFLVVMNPGLDQHALDAGSRPSLHPFLGFRVLLPSCGALILKHSLSPPPDDIPLR